MIAKLLRKLLGIKTPSEIAKKIGEATVRGFSDGLTWQPQERTYQPP